ncbi:WD40 repeat-like protein [Suillus weaverae]|nr:WD40 repeat-like protein [Suillus weaverae]
MAARLIARRTREEASTVAQWEEPILKHKFEGHEEMIRCFVFLHDNVHIVSGSEDGTLCKWNCDTGLVVGEPWKVEGGRVYALALSPDGNIIACGREDGSVQLWTMDGVIKDVQVWTGRSGWVQSLSWSPSGSHIASGSHNGTILIRAAESGKVEVGPIKTNSKQDYVRALAYSPSGERIASDGDNETICIWSTKTGKLVVGPIQGLGDSVTSLVWSSNNTKLYSASDRFARIFDSTSGELLHSFQHDGILYSVALSPKHNLLACVGRRGVAQLWDTESHQPLGKSLHQNYNTLCYVSFSRDGSHLAYGGSDNKLTLWMLKDTPLQLLAPTPLQNSDRQSTKQESRPSSPSSSCLDADATGGDGFIEEVHDDPYNNFFQSLQQSLPSPSLSPSPSPSPGFYLLPFKFLSARRFWNVIARHRSPPDESVPQERSKRGFFSRRARSNSSLDLATIIPNQPRPEGKAGEGEDKGDIDDDVSTNDSLSARKDQGKQQDDPPADVQSLPFDDRAPPARLNSKDNRSLWERLKQARGKNITIASMYPSTQLANAPQPRIPRNPWHWNSSLFPVGSSRRPVDVAACRDEDRYGIAPESDAEAAAAMLCTNDDVADSSTRPRQPAVVAQVSQGRPAQLQTSTSEPEEIGVSCCGFVFICRRRRPS